MEQKGIIKYLVLPSETTDVELAHVVKINKVALWACVAHIPLFMLVAWACNTSMFQAVVFGSLLVAGPLLASKTLKNPRTLSLVYGFTSMSLGALLVHLGQGPVQIEMHFHFFASLALLTVWGNPLIIWVAAITVAAHHGGFWFFLPESVFNYEAAFWVVAIHAAFVVVESIAASYIARNFYDNVIGLDKIVKAKTSQLNKRNEEMRLILDNTAQGFLVINQDGALASEMSSVVQKWFGEPAEGMGYDQFLGQCDEEFGKLTRFGLDEMAEDLLPLDYYLDSLPSTLKLTNDAGVTSIYDFKYSPITEGGESLLVVVSDVTEQLKLEREARRQLEIINIFDSISKDREGFEEFLKDAGKLVSIITKDTSLDKKDMARMVHTLKGNCGVFKLDSIASVCHEVEENMEENFGELTQDDREYLQSSWAGVTKRLEQFLSGDESSIEITKEELNGALNMIERNSNQRELKEVLNSWKYEPTRKRLDRLANQAKSLAKRLNKGDIDVECKHNDLRLSKEEYSGFWSVFSHVLRNSVDHGIESSEERAERSKAPVGKLTLETFKEGAHVVIRITDDGKGIDVDKVAEKAGASSADMAGGKVLDFICKDGLTTRDSVSDVSGRGVGMAAVKSFCDEHKINISVETNKDQGTTFEFRKAG